MVVVFAVLVLVMGVFEILGELFKVVVLVGVVVAVLTSCHRNFFLAFDFIFNFFPTVSSKWVRRPFISADSRGRVAGRGRCARGDLQFVGVRPVDVDVENPY